MVRGPASIRKLLLLAVVVALAGAALVSACSSSTDRNPAYGPPATDETPGVYDAGGGRSRVVGIVVRRDLEGGFWAIADADTPVDIDAAENLAVLVPALGGVISDDQFADAEGYLVVAEGILSDGPSIYMAGPVLEVDGLEVKGDREPKR